MHPVYVHNGFLLLAFVFFLFAGFNVASTKFSWIPLGYACVVAAFLFPFFI
jgi:hypothetical protein